MKNLDLKEKAHKGDHLKILVTGNGTDVGKTVVSGVLTTLFRGDYWKPIQCGDKETSDSMIMRQWLDPCSHAVHPPAYSFQAPVSPHHAARLENIEIEMTRLSPPHTLRPLIIESAGGILVPLTANQVALDLFETWNCQWVVVSHHYLGSINHTLLTIEALRRRALPILGLIFNGAPNPDSEAAILALSGLPMLGRLFPEPYINDQTFKKYGQLWRQNFSKWIL